MKIEVFTKDPGTTDMVGFEIVRTLYDSGLRGEALLEKAVLEYNKYSETFVDLGEENTWILDTETGEIKLQEHAFFRKYQAELTPEKREHWAKEERKWLAKEVENCETRMKRER